MSTPASQIGFVDAQRVEEALSLIAEVDHLVGTDPGPAGRPHACA
ncbi:hypothetical protein ACIREM_26720 [Streptomyces shenzhenensis]